MICIDASVAAKLVLPEIHSDRALTLAMDAVRAGERIVAPPLLPFEVANIMRQRMRRQGMERSEADELLADFLEYPIELIAPEGLYRRALMLADILGLPAVYDAHYLALSEMLDCQFWTDDGRLIRALGPSLPVVRRIGDYTGGTSGVPL